MRLGGREQKETASLARLRMFGIHLSLREAEPRRRKRSLRMCKTRGKVKDNFDMKNTSLDRIKEMRSRKKLRKG